MGALYNHWKTLGILAIAGGVAPAAYGANAPVVEMIGGGAAQVSVKRAGQSLQLHKGDSLQPGDELTTDRSTAVDIRLEDRTLIRVGANSTYRLEEDSKMQKLFHRLLGGIVRVLVPKREKTTEVRFRLNTPEGTIGVRGTEFVVIEQPGRTDLKGLEGEVMFGPKDANFADVKNFVFVKKGFQSSVKAGEAKPAAPSEYDLPSYLKDLEGGAFASLKDRASAVVRARSSEPVAAVARAPVVAAAPKAKSLSIGERVEKPPVKKSGVPSPNERLFASAEQGDVKGMAAALAAKADVNFANPALGGSTPLHIASYKGNLEAVQFLLSHKADVNAREAEGRTPLMLVAGEAPSELIVGALFDGKANEDLKDLEGHTALDLARESAAQEKDPAKKALFEKVEALLAK